VIAAINDPREIIVYNDVRELNEGAMRYFDKKIAPCGAIRRSSRRCSRNESTPGLLRIDENNPACG
jgi:hypothetical protein